MKDIRGNLFFDLMVLQPADSSEGNFSVPFQDSSAKLFHGFISLLCSVSVHGFFSERTYHNEITLKSSLSLSLSLSLFFREKEKEREKERIIKFESICGPLWSMRM